MKYIILSCSLLFPCTTRTADSWGADSIGTPPPAKSPPPREDFSNRSYPQGIVTAIDKSSITIECPKHTRKTAKPGPGGTTLWVDEVVAAVPPKKFALSPVLTRGEVPSEPRDRYRVHETDMYRICDVKVGDWVSIIYAQVDGVEFCDHINIVKRPGGKVPKLPDGVPELSRIPYHERMNAYWDLEDKGIAYPERFGGLRRFPIAPPPRAVTEPRPIE